MFCKETKNIIIQTTLKFSIWTDWTSLKVMATEKKDVTSSYVNLLHEIVLCISKSKIIIQWLLQAQ